MLPKAKLPMGFRFHPTDVELINFLKRYVHRGILPPDGDIEVAKIGVTEPWQIFGDSNSKEKTRYFVSKLKRFKNSTKKFSRTVGRGTWKDQSGGAPIKHGSKNIIVGFRRSLKYKSNIVKEQNDKWLMKEYILAEDYFKESNEDIIVLCKIKDKKMNEKKVDGNEIMEEEVDELVTSLSGSNEEKTWNWEGDSSGALTVPITDTGEQVEYIEVLERNHHQVTNNDMNQLALVNDVYDVMHTNEANTLITGTFENQGFEAYGQEQANYLAAGVEQNIDYQYADYSNDWFLSMINFEVLPEQDLGMQIDKPIK
ncbi:NAC domain-containing protein 41-like [Nicotiana sylvestris]|uniref:NAC domain-containing protein 41-like n=2 Tax=Nicotiana TaxID=4085 RepID=A0A1S3X9T1_TOBAC|nr:PREDICTED: NAC domain-containing protein 2-like [Nicotiana sylvestris]XP_016436667.1 PREDICTED: NAC domain-containing protein 41-like [Nicotiana tabacum]